MGSQVRGRLGSPHPDSVHAMKAAVYYETGGPEVFRYEDVPDPVCGPGAVLIDVKAISIEGGDTLHRAGRRAWRAGRTSSATSAPAWCARSASGVTDVASAQRVVAVMMHGSHAELVAVPALMTWVLPDGLDLEHGACVPIPFGTADDCLFEFGRLQAGETVLVHAGRRRRRHRGDPARQARRRDRAGDGLERREARAAEGVRARPRHQLPRRRLRRARCAS